MIGDDSAGSLPGSRTGPIVVMGVAGAGKTTVARAMANSWGMAFKDADDLHTSAARSKMAAGVPLGDADRWPWLASVGRWLNIHGDAAVMSCSTLARRYRDAIRKEAPTTFFVYLALEPAIALQRVAARENHFMPPELVQSQFDTLEPPDNSENAIQVDATLPLPAILELLAGALGVR